MYSQSCVDPKKGIGLRPWNSKIEIPKAELGENKIKTPENIMTKKISFGWIISLIGSAENEKIKQLKVFGLKHIFTGSYKNDLSKGHSTPHAGWNFASTPSDRENIAENYSISQFFSSQAYQTRKRMNENC